MKLSYLLENQDVRIICPEGGPHSPREDNGHVSDPDISDITYNSAQVKKDGLFVAINGFTVDGHTFIEDAIKKGASVIISQKDISGNAFIVRAKDTRKLLAAVSARYFGNPSEKLFMIGITGTNGKTTTVAMIEKILQEKGFSVGVIGTIDYHYKGKTVPNPMTTPESLDLQKILAEMHENGVTHVVMEVSSHAIDLCRVADCWFDVGVFTNLSQDHLDFHKTMDAYWKCKKRFFTEILPAGPKKDRAKAVINISDENGGTLPEELSMDVISTGEAPAGMIRPEGITYDVNGISGKIITPAGEIKFHSKAVGKHNLENILNAVGAGFAIGLPLSAIENGVNRFNCVPGRLERILNGKERNVFVDYAHTPDALFQVLSVLKPITTGRLISVFGCGGDRDAQKRPLMGGIAGALSDISIVTSDNPRTENPETIIKQIVEGLKEKNIQHYTEDEFKKTPEKKGFLVQPDRREAIKLAVRLSVKGDTILIAGKGHEDYQIIGKTKHTFDDRVEAEAALSDDAE